MSNVRLILDHLTLITVVIASCIGGYVIGLKIADAVAGCAQ